MSTLKNLVNQTCNNSKSFRRIKMRAHLNADSLYGLIREDFDKVKELMLKPIAGEITEREPFDGYLIMQGGIPEVEEFIGRHRR